MNKEQKRQQAQDMLMTIRKFPYFLLIIMELLNASSSHRKSEAAHIQGRRGSLRKRIASWAIAENEQIKINKQH